jgi:hypothetical protein
LKKAEFPADPENAAVAMNFFGSNAFNSLT